MAYFKIEEPRHAVKYIKEIDRANGTLEFSESKAGCFQQDSGFFADSEFAYLKFHFTEAYPELQYMTIDNDWRQYGTQGVADVQQEEPNNPWNHAAIEGEEAPQPDNVAVNEAVGAAADAQAAIDLYAPQLIDVGTPIAQ